MERARSGENGPSGLVNASDRIVWDSNGEWPIILQNGEYHIPAPKMGLRGLVHVKLADPRFVSPTKDKLGTPEAKTAVFEVVNRFLDTYFAAHPEVVSKLAERFS